MGRGKGSKADDSSGASIWLDSRAIKLFKEESFRIMEKKKNPWMTPSEIYIESIAEKRGISSEELMKEIEQRA